jgi:uncharacterized protein with NAD-binding domain and iron-sulfur cluster
MPATTARKKIAILGGGVGAMTAAFELTAQPDWQDRYEITVYQLGWRLGGKGASGRNAACQQRIEEHGLHIWFGFYENAFALMRRCYEELGRPPECPLATWDEAFRPQQGFALEERVAGGYTPMTVTLPLHDGEPGDGTSLPNIGETLLRAATEVNDWLRQAPPSAAPPAAPKTSRLAERIGARAGKPALDLSTRLSAALLERATRATLAHHAKAGPRASLLYRLFWRLFLQVRRGLSAVLAPVLDRYPATRHLWQSIDWMSAMISGVIHDRLLERGFDVINAMDYRTWLERRGLARQTLRDARLVGVYDTAFATLHAAVGRALPGRRRITEADVAAGTALRAILRLGFGYKGAYMYKMQAGMGDVVFAPLYEVLKRRGVRFKFFHRVRALHLSGDGRSIDRITVGRQVTLREGVEYDPLVYVEKLPCWPSRPKFDLIVEGQELQEQGVDLESYWTPWKDREIFELHRGADLDFDEVVLGISLGALGVICAELVSASEKWRNLVGKVPAVRTQALQLWLKPTLAELGWPLWRAGAPTLTSYAEPLDTWADMTHLVPREQWPAGQTPGHIAYFCGTMRDDPTPDPPYFSANATFAEGEHEKVKGTALRFLRERIATLWPNAMQPDGGRFNWDLLLDPAGGTGQQRFDAQYWHANIDPTERYVLSVPGSIQYRLPSGQSGFTNLYLAGDWTRTGLDLGCVEAAVMSGMQASRALSGWPQEVPGEHDI